MIFFVLVLLGVMAIAVYKGICRWRLHLARADYARARQAYLDNGRELSAYIKMLAAQRYLEELGEKY